MNISPVAVEVIAPPPDTTPLAAVTDAPTFSQFGLHADILRAVSEMGYVVPTPIQAAAISVVMSGRDVMGAAQTGTGKTAGFALPILHQLMQHASSSSSPARHPVRALMIAPTRELADQIYMNVREYAKYTPLRVACVYGGVDIKPQTEALRRGCEILIATPGRLLDHVQQKTVNLGLASLLVLDEADRMLDMGFLPDIQRIINLLPKQRQSLMFSATFSNEIKKLAETFLNAPQLIEVARRNATNENVSLEVFQVASSEAKRLAVTKLVRERELRQVIVFTNTKIGASRLARQLEKDGLNAGAIHGDKTQLERLKTLEDFKAGLISILVATDVAARGLDIVELPAVINYDIPRAPEDYVHRIGRTGRAGATGLAISLIAPGDERYLADIEKLIKRKLTPVQLEIEVSARESDQERAPRRERSGSGRSESGRTDSKSSNVSRTDSSAGADGKSSRARPARPFSPGFGYSKDPFFFQPYQPSATAAAATGVAAVSAQSVASAASSSNSIKRGKRPLASLLGGRPPALV
jgi:ATP-dependent RNA helicase RhlE